MGYLARLAGERNGLRLATKGEPSDLREPRLQEAIQGSEGLGEVLLKALCRPGSCKELQASCEAPG